MLFLSNKITSCPSRLIVGLGILFMLVGLSACRTDTPLPDQPTPYQLDIPAGFPIPPIPTENPLTVESIALGRKLFFDPILSRDTSVSCATCHLPDKAFADNLPIAVGIHGRTGLRNVPSLFNVAWHPYFFREGGSPNLEQQALAPIADELEMDLTVAEAAERLRQDPDYLDLAQQAYNRPPNAYVISRALASYQRTLVSANAPYDRFIRGNNAALNAAQLRGRNLFFNELSCSNCHGGFNFTNFSIENNGLYENYTDEGRARLTALPEDIGRFKVPSLRNVALTAPYMHDGSLSTLEAVIEHYNSGGKSHPNKHPLIQPLNLSEAEKNDLIQFLESLTE